MKTEHFAYEWLSDARITALTILTYQMILLPCQIFQVLEEIQSINLDDVE